MQKDPWVRQLHIECEGPRFQTEHLAQIDATFYMNAMETDPQHRLKRIVFRAWHRGMKEVDLVLGPFADAHVAALDETDLAEFEILLNVSDQDLYDWLCERRTPPDRYRTKLYEQIFDFSRRPGRV